MTPRTAIIALALTAALPGAAEDLYVPAAAHSSGVAGTEWRTDLEVKARGNAAAAFRVELLAAETDNSSPHGAVFDVAATECLRIEDLLEEVFAYTGNGALRITATAGEVLVTSRTYNDDPEGTYGQFIPALPASSAAGPEVDVALIQLSRSADLETGYRTNVGFLNATAADLSLEIDVLTAAGALLGTGTYELVPWEFRQVNDIFASFTTEDVDDGYVLVRTTTEGGLFFAYASVVDNRSGDAIFIPGQEDEPRQQEVPRFVVFEAFMRHG